MHEKLIIDLNMKINEINGSVSLILGSKGSVEYRLSQKKGLPQEIGKNRLNPAMTRRALSKR